MHWQPPRPAAAAELHAKLRVARSPRQDKTRLLPIPPRPGHYICLPSDCTAYPRVNSRELYQSNLSPRLSLPNSSSSQTYHPPTTTPPPQPCHTTTLPLLLPRTSQAPFLYRVRPTHFLYSSQQHRLTQLQSPVSRRSSLRTTISTAAATMPPS
jgi:hypothetical protein